MKSPEEIFQVKPDHKETWEWPMTSYELLRYLEDRMLVRSLAWAYKLKPNQTVIVKNRLGKPFEVRRILSFEQRRLQEQYGREYPEIKPK